jgi:hypothetical protein
MAAGSSPKGMGGGRADQGRAGAGDRSSAGRHGPSVSRPVTKLLLGAVFALVFLGLFFLTTGGCRPGVDTAYARRQGSSWSSVNGTGVLGKMFENAGHTVFSWQMLSPRLRRRADCIVWFANDFSPPSGKVCDWLESWLREEPGRTLIYVGRDFDAALWYWEQILPGAPPDQKAEIQRRRVEAKSQFNSELRTITTAEECEWFTITKGQHREVRSLQGDPKWLEGVDPSKLAIELNHRLVASRRAEVLLESEGDALVSSERVDQSRLIVVANGSFLLNLALVNHEHRKLAGQLIDEVGPPARTVVFLETFPGGPPIFDLDPKSGPPSGLAIFNVWPTSWILMHLAAVGILFCFFRFPIFGRPRDPEPKGTSDFGRHIQALGELLERSGNRELAAARLAQYQQLTRADSAAPRSDAAAPAGKSDEETKTKRSSHKRRPSPFS